MTPSIHCNTEDTIFKGGAENDCRLITGTFTIPPSLVVPVTTPSWLMVLLRMSLFQSGSGKNVIDIDGATKATINGGSGNDSLLVTGTLTVVLTPWVLVTTLLKPMVLTIPKATLNG